MRVLVVGAGVGGPAVGSALRRLGHEVVVFEAREGPVPSAGLFLTLAVNGLRALRELDLLDGVLRTDVIPTPVLEFTSSTGKRIGSVGNGWLDGETPGVTLQRGALQGALVDGAQARGVAFHWGRRFVGCEQAATGVVARFDDGSEVEGHLLVGADGVHSRVRCACVPDAPRPSYTGLLNLGGTCLRPDLPATPGVMRMLWGSRGFFGYTTREGGETWWFANVGQAQEPARGELGAVPTAEWKRRLGELFADDPPFVRDIVESTDEIPATPIHDLATVPTWCSGRAVLLGDAAHAVSPSSGQGASQALEDAVALAKCLRDVTPVDAALARYEALRRPRAERIVADGRRRGTYKAPSSRGARFVRDLLMPVVLPLFANERRLAWIHEHRDPWHEPVAS